MKVVLTVSTFVRSTIARRGLGHVEEGGSAGFIFQVANQMIQNLSLGILFWCISTFNAN